MADGNQQQGSGPMIPVPLTTHSQGVRNAAAGLRRVFKDREDVVEGIIRSTEASGVVDENGDMIARPVTDVGQKPTATSGRQSLADLLRERQQVSQTTQRQPPPPARPAREPPVRPEPPPKPESPAESRTTQRRPPVEALDGANLAAAALGRMGKPRRG